MSKKMSGASSLVQSLESAGVDVMFGLPGGAILPAYDPIFDSKIRHILVRHEQGAGHAATGYAQVTGRVGVCIATSGPGATNLVTPLADAAMDSVPLVAITGQVPSVAIGTDAFQEADIRGITMPFTKHNYLITDPKDIPRAIAEAFYIAGSGRPGPVLVDIAKDALQKETDFVYPKELSLPGYHPQLEPENQFIKDAAALIAQSSKPVFYVGGGVIKSNASKELMQLAELVGAPVVTTLMALGSFPDSHPQDQQLVPQALQLLKDEPAKNFRIEVTSDSMIYQDEQQEKADRIEFLTAVSQFMNQALPVATQAPELTPLLMEMLKFGVTAFKAGKGMEGLIDETADDFRNKAKAMEGQPKPPSPEMQKIQAQTQAKMQEMQMSVQLEQQKMAAQIEFEKAKQEYQAQENQLKFQLEEQRNAQDREMEMKLAQMKMMTERNTQLLLAYINNGAKIETARISAGVDSGEGIAEEYTMDEDMLRAQEHPLAPIANAIAQGNQDMTATLGALIDRLNQPKQVLRDENGKIIGVQ